MHLVLVTDAWEPQVNGVVRTWQHVRDELTAQGHTFNVIHPGLFKTFAAPRYPEIRLALFPRKGIRQRLTQWKPDAVHLATEGPLGRHARAICKRLRWPFTTSYHTQFPQYLHRYFRVPVGITYAVLRAFHNDATATLVPTAGIHRELTDRGFKHPVTWTRGVDTTLFQPGATGVLGNLPRPIFLYAGRIAWEKNLEAFLQCDLPGSKVFLGDGPARKALQAKYPAAHFLGYHFGKDLAQRYADADVFVFPSLTDTFGIVLLEANACGLPCAAFPVTGPIDVVKPGVSGSLNPNLRQACLDALNVPRASCRAYAEQHTWSRCAQMVLDHAARIPRA